MHLLRNSVAVGLMLAVSLVQAAPEVITFDEFEFGEATTGLPFFNFDSSDDDDLPDVVFSTTDPSGFFSAGPGDNQLFIAEPGLEGGTGRAPDLRVDLLRGAVDFLSFGFATVDFGRVTFSAFDGDALINSIEVASVFSDVGDGFQSDFPEAFVGLSLLGQTATHAIFDFEVEGRILLGGIDENPLPRDDDGPLDDFGGRYIIDNFLYTAAGEDVINDFIGSLPEDPVLPGNITFGENGVPTFEFEFEVDENGLGQGFPIFIDPDVAVGYDYEVTGGNRVTGILIPDALPGGDDTFQIALPGVDDLITVLAGEMLDLLPFSANGFDFFTILGIDVGEELDPENPLAFVTGLTFLNSGSTSVTQTPIIESVGVPAPLVHGALLGLMGLYGFRKLARWARA